MIYKTQALSGIWELREAAGAIHCPGRVPGTVISDLLENNQIEDPYWRCNEYDVREYLNRDYLYERCFWVEEEDFGCDVIELVCDGLDTIASVYINELLIAETDDMHRSYRFPVRGYLHSGENRIRVLFRSPMKFVWEEDAGNDIFYASTGCMHGNAALRKAHYMFGWDWGPQLPDMGIFRDIRIEYSHTARFRDVHIRQFFEDDGSVRLDIMTVLRHLTKTDAELYGELVINDPNGELVHHSRYPWETKTKSVRIEKPQLWWPNGLGAQPLYEVKLTLMKVDRNVCDHYHCRLGLRTVTVSTDRNEYGNEFAITVNGIRIFAMGANYIPEDSILTRVTRKRTERLVQDCAAANYNCLRVWGGGYYPDDYFYDACDEAGILVWQDLMFGCNVYALTDSFEINIIAETKDNVRRLRHHACLALWCGNNEMEWGWGDMWARIKGHHPRYKADYIKIFEHILPRAIRSCDDTTFYWPSSPSSGGSFDDPNSINRGDQHYWEVWHSGKPFTEYGDFSFCSEYGFQSFPHSKTIERFTLPEDRNIFSKVMESHQKNGSANGKILNYIADYFRYPKDLDSLAYISQILQLKAISYGVEHWRRKRGRCMGSLYWQLGDCWPVASWASIDYYGRWKALHYGARRFYAPFTISISERQELSPHLSYYLHNDTRKARRGTMEMQLLTSDFHLLWAVRRKCEVEPLAVEQCLEQDFSQWTEAEGQRERVFSVFRLYDKKELLSERTMLFVKPKHFCYGKPEYQVAVEERSKDFTITVTASCFCQYVELFFRDYDPVFSDNFFDITSPSGVTVTVSKKDFPDHAAAELLKQNLVVRSIADSN